MRVASLHNTNLKCLTVLYAMVYVEIQLLNIPENCANSEDSLRLVGVKIRIRIRNEAITAQMH